MAWIVSPLPDQLLSAGECEDVRIQRTFVANSCGEQTATGTQIITIRNPSLSDVILPQGEMEFSCEEGGIPTDANGNPVIDFAGEPYITTAFTDSLSLADMACRNLAVSFTDATESGCSGTQVITRTWTVTDFCTNETRTSTQSVSSVDNEAPIGIVPYQQPLLPDHRGRHHALPHGRLRVRSYRGHTTA